MFQVAQLDKETVTMVMAILQRHLIMIAEAVMMILIHVALTIIGIQ